MSDSTLVGASAAALSYDTPKVPRLLRKSEFLRLHPDISERLMTRMIDRGQIDVVRIGSVDRIVDGSYERHVMRQLAGKRG
jgi:hypothetical protein